MNWKMQGFCDFLSQVATPTPPSVALENCNWRLFNKILPTFLLKVNKRWLCNLLADLLYKKAGWSGVCMAPTGFRWSKNAVASLFPMLYIHILPQFHSSFLVQIQDWHQKSCHNPSQDWSFAVLFTTPFTKYFRV